MLEEKCEETVRTWIVKRWYWYILYKLICRKINHQNRWQKPEHRVSGVVYGAEKEIKKCQHISSVWGEKE